VRDKILRTISDSSESDLLKKKFIAVYQAHLASHMKITRLAYYVVLRTGNENLQVSKRLQEIMLVLNTAIVDNVSWQVRSKLLYIRTQRPNLYGCVRMCDVRGINNEKEVF